MRRQACLALTGIVLLSACASTRRGGEPPPPPPPPPPAYGEGSAPPVVSTKPAKALKPAQSGPAGAVCRYCVSNDVGKRQYFDQRRKRYYYFDRARKAYFWENGEPKI